MNECSICGKEDKLVTLTQECTECDNIFAKLGSTIKSSHSAGRVSALRKRLVAAFADAQVYIEIMDN